MNQLIFFFMGAALAAALFSILWMAWSEDYEAQIRYWRKEALKAKSK